jgi:hypothetical protein
MLAGEDGFWLSLSGAQDKLPVIFDGKRIGVAGGPSWLQSRTVSRQIAGALRTMPSFCICANWVAE